MVLQIWWQLEKGFMVSYKPLIIANISVLLATDDISFLHSFFFFLSSHLFIFVFVSTITMSDFSEIDFSWLQAAECPCGFYYKAVNMTYLKKELG